MLQTVPECVESRVPVVAGMKYENWLLNLEHERAPIVLFICPIVLKVSNRCAALTRSCHTAPTTPLPSVTHCATWWQGSDGKCCTHTNSVQKCNFLVRGFICMGSYNLNSFCLIRHIFVRSEACWEADKAWAMEHGGIQHLTTWTRMILGNHGMLWLSQSCGMSRLSE